MQSSLTIVACPYCRGDLDGTEELRCGSCGRIGRRLADGLLDFGAKGSDAAAAIAAWPEDMIRELPAWAEGLAEGRKSMDAGCFELLQFHNLVTADGSLTPLGEAVRYHLDEYRWQKGRKGLDGLLELSDIGPTVRVLDVGCGAAQTLRRLEPDRPIELFGVDVDVSMLALGWRLARSEGSAVSLAGVSATTLPFCDGAFDLVVTRVALNYMHQSTALGEMVRVLRPGGFLFCRVERIWHDLALLAGARRPKELLCRMRDLGWGALHAATGWQPTPGSTLRGGRAFASARRLRRILSRRNCTVLRAADSPNGPKTLGHTRQLILVARKEG